MRAHLFPLTVLLGLAAQALAGPMPDNDSAALVEAGRRIYEQGILPNGAPLSAVREQGIEVSGAGAACILCHRRSGFGGVEGYSYVPPITAPALFGKPAEVGQRSRTAPGVRKEELPNKARSPYTDATLAKALREGLSPIGHSFQYMMPRYRLDDEAMRALVAYLRTLSAQPAPGAEERLAHFATVIAPDTDPARRRMMVDVLKACFRENYPEDYYDPQGKVKREDRLAWRLHVWELEGPAATWKSQLESRMAAQPVFAMVSGLAGENWAPVHEYCQANRIPCLFPNADAPGSPAESTYNFYLYKGVYLEAEALAQWLGERREQLGLKRLVQVSRQDTAGAAAAAHLRKLLEGGPIAVEDRGYDPDPARLFAGLARTDALVFWIRAPELELLVGKAKQPPQVGAFLVSGTLGGADRPPLTPEWKREARIVYPFDPPLRWQNRMKYNLRPWLQKNGLPVADERLQGNTLTACNFLVTGVATLQGRYFRDYLLEQSEVGLEGNQAAPSAFPRFSLGPNQRFGAKGAFVVRFESPEGERIVRDSDWIVP